MCVCVRVCMVWVRGDPDGRKGRASFVCVRRRELSVSFYEELGLFRADD